MRRNKIDTGWNAIPKKNKTKEKRKISWTTQYESFPNIDEKLFSKIVKFLISISLYFVINKTSYLNKRKKEDIVNLTYESLSSSKFTFIPAGVGLYFFLSFIPIVIITTSIIKLFPMYFDILTKDVLSYVIPGIGEMFNTIDLNGTLVNLALVFFVISLVWFSSKGITKFTDSFISIYDYEYNTNWFVKRIKGILVVVLISAFFIVWSFAYLPLLELIKNNIQHSNSTLYEFLFFISMIIYLAFFGYIGIGFLFIFVPPFKLTWKQIKPGIIVSLFPIILFVVIFGTLTKYLNYEKFGAIGTFIYALLFVLYISYFLHAGIIVNSSYYHSFFSPNIVKKKRIISKKIFNSIQNIFIFLKKW